MSCSFICPPTLRALWFWISVSRPSSGLSVLRYESFWGRLFIASVWGCGFISWLLISIFRVRLSFVFGCLLTFSAISWLFWIFWNYCLFLISRCDHLENSCVVRKPWSWTSPILKCFFWYFIHDLAISIDLAQKGFYIKCGYWQQAPAHWISTEKTNPNIAPSWYISISNYTQFWHCDLDISRYQQKFYFLPYQI